MRAAVRPGPLEIPRPSALPGPGLRGDGRGPGTDSLPRCRRLAGAGGLSGRGSGLRADAGAIVSARAGASAAVARSGLRRRPARVAAHEQRGLVDLRDDRVDRDPRPHREQRPLRGRGRAHGHPRQLLDPGLLAPRRPRHHRPRPHGDSALLRRPAKPWPESRSSAGLASGRPAGRGAGGRLSVRRPDTQLAEEHRGQRCALLPAAGACEGRAPPPSRISIPSPARASGSAGR